MFNRARVGWLGLLLLTSVTLVACGEGRTIPRQDGGAGAGSGGHGGTGGNAGHGGTGGRGGTAGSVSSGGAGTGGGAGTPADDTSEETT